MAPIQLANARHFSIKPEHTDCSVHIFNCNNHSYKLLGVFKHEIHQTRSLRKTCINKKMYHLLQWLNKLCIVNIISDSLIIISINIHIKRPLQQNVIISRNIHQLPTNLATTITITSKNLIWHMQCFRNFFYYHLKPSLNSTSTFTKTSAINLAYMNVNSPFAKVNFLSQSKIHFASEVSSSFCLMKLNYVKTKKGLQSHFRTKLSSLTL